MRIDRATPDDIRAVAMGMRETDLKEFLATSFANSRLELADELVSRYTGGAIVVKIGDQPVVIGDVVEHRPNVLTLFLYATERFGDVAAPLTRFVRQRLLAPMKQVGVHRIEAVSLVGHHEAHRWIKALGLKQEGLFRGFGKNGEDFIQFAWVKDGNGRQIDDGSGC